MKSIPTTKVVDLVNLASQQIGLSTEDTQKLAAMVQDLLPPDDDGEEKVPRQKQQFGVLVSDPLGVLTTDHVAWVYTLPEEDSVADVNSRIKLAAHTFNATKRGRMTPVNTVGEACEAVPTRFFKEQRLTIKTKVPVVVMKTDNKLGEAPTV